MGQEFEYGGVDLNTYGYNIRLLGAPLSVPGRRQENLIVPHKTGRVYVDKRPDQRIVTLAGFVRNVLPNTGKTPSDAQMLANLDVLRGAFARDGQHVLKQKQGGATRVALAEVVGPVLFEPQGVLNVYAFVVDFQLADPWWYAESATVVLPVGITMSPQNITITNAGSRASEHGVFTINGPAVNPRLTIGAYWVQYTGTLGGLDLLTINVGTFTATLAGADVSGAISHEGGTVWLPIAPGANTLRVTLSGYSTETKVGATFTAPYA